MRNLGCFLAIVLCARPICLAAMRDSRSPDRTLKDSTPTRDQMTIDPDRMLREAVTHLDLAGVQDALLKGANPNHVESLPFVRSSILRDALVYGSFRPDREKGAAENRCLQIVKALFDAGAKIQAVDASILEFPILAGHTEVAAFLLSKGANANGNSEEGLSWVELSEAYDQTQIADLLIKHGAKAVSPRDATQLRYLQALWHGSFIQMEKALRDGARVDEGYKARDVPLCELLRNPIYDFERYAMLLFLLNKKPNLNARSQGARGGAPGTPLHIATASTALLFERASGKDASQRVTEAAFVARLSLEALVESGASVAARRQRQDPLARCSEGEQPCRCGIASESGFDGDATRRCRENTARLCRVGRYD